MVKAAQKALAAGNVILALTRARQKDEGEARKAFQKALAVRRLNPEAREMADMYFFETFVRLHRAGEGEPYTGIKPAGRDLGPAAPAADKAIEQKSAQQLRTLLTGAIQEGLQNRFKNVLGKSGYSKQNMAVGVCNFVGAGIFGFLINLPIVSHFEVGTTLTPNHGRAALFGVFGRLALALLVFCLRTMQSDSVWKGTEKYIRLGFWGLNAGLALMIILDLFPGGVIQLWDSIANGYWHTRRLTFLMSGTYHELEWVRIVGDTVFLLAGALPIAFGTLRGVWKRDLSATE